MTFLWNGIATAEGFSIGFAPEYFFPILICFIISTVESIGPPRNSAQFWRNSGAIRRNSAQFGAIRRNSSDALLHPLRRHLDHGGVLGQL